MGDLWIYDTETDGLLDEVTKYHCLVFKKYRNDKWAAFCNHQELNPKFINNLKDEINIELYPVSAFKDWLLENVVGMVCHNQLGFDLWCMDKLLGVKFDLNPDRILGKDIRIIDSLTMSRTLYPDRPLPKGCPDSVYNPVTGRTQKVGSHGLMAWGYRVANAKPQVDDWRNQPLHVYLHRCIEDVKINELTYSKLLLEAKDCAIASDGWSNALRASHIRDFLMYKQEYGGVQFNKEAADKLLVEVDEMLDNIASEVEPTLPPKKIGKTSAKAYLPPKNQFKQSGELSSHMLKFIEKHNGEVVESHKEQIGARTKKEIEIVESIKLYDKIYKLPMDREVPVIDTEPMTLSNQDDIKQYFVSMGWEPTIWRYRDLTRDSAKKNHPDSVVKEKVSDYIDEMIESPYRKYIEKEMEVSFSISKSSLEKKLLRKARFLAATPQLKDQRGELCPKLQLLEDDRCQKIVKWLSLRNRRAVLKAFDEKASTGWLNNSRLDVDGRLPAGSSGVTNTGRQKHRTVVNVPKAEDGVLLGKEFRSLFIAKEGFKIVGGDAQALENRVGGWYAYPFDKGAYAKKMLEEDSHTINAKAYSAAAGFEISRGAGKNITYGVMYGAQAPKIAKMLGVDVQTAQRIIDAFWEENYGLAEVKKRIEKYWEETGKKYIRGIDGRKIYTRSKHSLLNCLFQSCGAIVMDYAGIFLDKWLKQEGLYEKGVSRVLYIHDEYQFEVPEDLIDGDKSIVGDLIVKSIRQAGKHLGSPLLIDAEYMIGDNWADTH